MKIALAQLAPCPDDTPRMVGKISAAARAAAACSATVLVVPELVFPGYNVPALHQNESQSPEGTWRQAMADVARSSGLALCYGWAEQAAEGVFNAASVLDANGACIAHYRKIQLFGPMERQSFQAGPDLPPVFTLGGQSCSVLICYDIEFPEHARALARRGAEVLLVPTANPQDYPHVPQTLVPARACENGLTIAYANYVGDDHGLTFGGQSIIVGADGQALATAGSTETLLVADCPPRAAYPADGLSTQLADLRLPGTD